MQPMSYSNSKHGQRSSGHVPVQEVHHYKSQTTRRLCICHVYHGCRLPIVQANEARRIGQSPLPPTPTTARPHKPPRAERKLNPPGANERQRGGASTGQPHPQRGTPATPHPPPDPRVAQWVHRTSSVLWRRVGTPGGIETHRTTRKPLYAKDRESGAHWEEGRREGERERERAGERERERGGERPTEQESGTNRHCGRLVGWS